MYSQDEKDKMAMKNATIDKFTARGDGDGANRGDRMVARGERKIERATAQLGNRLENKADREQNKLERKEKRAGEFPTLGQSERIASAKKEAKKSGDNLNTYKQTNEEYDVENYSKNRNIAASKLNRKYGPSFVSYVGDNVSNAEFKTQKGERLVKKGTMLSAKINNRRKG
jgi:hypothetical protein